MDVRWKPYSRDSKRDVRIILHPTASIWDVRRGLDPGSDDSVDLSEFVTQGSHSVFDANITFNFNRELFGDKQPKPNQVLEIQLWQADEWKPIWLGIVDAISSFTLQRGERSMQLVAKSRDSQDIWRNTKRVTPLFPMLTNFTYMAQKVARSAGMMLDEIVLPVTAFTTAHSNTQLADMTAWDMLTQIFLPIGWTPWVDGLGRLRAADRSLQGRIPDVMLEDSRLVKIGGQRQRPPKNRVRVMWLNPTLKKNIRMGQLLNSYTVTLGWFIPLLWKRVNFSDDKTQRAINTYFKGNPSCNANFFGLFNFPFVKEWYVEQTTTQGKLWFVNFQVPAVLFTMYQWAAAHKIPDVVPGTGVTKPVGREVEAVWMIAMMTLMMTVGTGNYEIWGQPYDWVHARNTSEAFDMSVPHWVDNSMDIESDFIINEPHAKAVAIRELIYSARSANKWGVTLVDDPRIEYGDILQFTDGSQLYVEDIKRSLERGSEATLDVSGFLIKPLLKAVAGPPIGDVGPAPPQGPPIQTGAYSTATTSMGTQIVFPHLNGPTTVQFGADAPIQLVMNGQPFHGVYPFAVAVGTDEFAVCLTAEDIDGHPNNAVVIQRGVGIIRTLVGEVYGAWGIGLSPSGEVAFVQMGGEKYTIGSLTDVTIGMRDPTAQGFAWIDEVVHFNDSNKQVEINNVKFDHYRESGDWAVGIDHESSRVLAYHKTTMSMYVVWVGVNTTEPNITQQEDGSAIVTLSLPSAQLTPAQHFITSAAFQTYGPPSEVDFGSAGRAIGVPFFFDPGEYYSITKNQAGPFTFIDITKPDPAVMNGPIKLYYCDRYGLNPADVPEDGWSCLFSYAVDTGAGGTAGRPISPEGVVSRLQADIAVHKAAGKRMAVVMQSYTMGIPPNNKFTVDQVKAVQLAVWETIRVEPTIDFCILFAYDRLDGMTANPELLENANKMRAASDDWMYLPTMR